VLRLSRGRVVSVEPLTVEVRGERRRAWADVGLIGEVAEGDEVVVNTEALDLGLGSGGFDVVHVNLSRGLDRNEPGAREPVMKLNYTSLQHSVDPVEPPPEAARDRTAPVLVIPLHGHLAPAAWAAAALRPGLRVGYVQTAGGALPGSLSLDVPTLRELGIVAGHTTVAPSYGGALEAISLVGALDAAAGAELGWDAVIAGPGPGILGSATRYGHGGMAALDTAHAALALGLATLVSPRLSSSDPRERHRGLSHHTQSVLQLLLGAVRVPVPEAEVEGWPVLDAGAPEGGSAQAALDSLIEICGGRHDIAVEPIDLDAYAASGLPVHTMGRTIQEDPLFFAAALAAGRALAGAAAG
jgi:Protein of unknown function (DUF3866)